VTRLRTGTIELPTAEVGGLNPLPPLFGSGNADRRPDLSQASPEIRANAEYGRIDSVCPYLLQDRYGRERATRSHPVAVLENEHLTATFLLDAGGRLWSLVDRASGGELLFRNPIFQPANLALRNAWFAGGVEWNIGTTGHTPATCDPMHAGVVRDDDGTPVLRMWEFDRIRRVVYQLDVRLPPGSDVLLVAVRIVNPNDHDVPMYWWSNMAVPQNAGTRVLAPADRAWNYAYDEVLRLVEVAGDAGDISFPAGSDAADAADFFFDLPAAVQPFVAAVDAEGFGVFQTSTPEMLGRKLFRWGTGPGGRRWQEWLCGSGTGYAEIQAGLARTQLEHLRMPAGARWSWLEAYGRLHLPPETAHGDWESARAAAGVTIADRLPPTRLADVHAAAVAAFDREPEQILHAGSGWGALERRKRTALDEPPLDLTGTPFPADTLGPEQHDWLSLLDSGALPDRDPSTFPPSVEVDQLWEPLLQRAAGWQAPALLGVIRAHRGELEGARAAWVDAVQRAPNAFSWRNLACLSAKANDAAAAAEEYQRALALAPAEPALLVETLGALIVAGRPDAALGLIDRSPPQPAGHGRVRMLEARAAVATGDLDRARAILTGPLEVPDLREGEDSLADLWWEYSAALVAAGRPTIVDPAMRAEVRRTVAVPTHLDFRMRVDPRC
jgi:tetratricopeptide (TPR) repeat protein